MSEFDITRRIDGREFLTLKPDKLKECLEYAEKKNITDFICFWDKLDNIEDYSILQRVTVTGLITNFGITKSNAAVNNFKNLNILISIFSEPITTIDFSKLKQLRQLEITYNKNIELLSVLINLENLRLWKYKPISKNLSEFCNYKKIEKILLVYPIIDSLDGIEKLTNLNELEITRSKTLKSFFISSLENSLLGLKELRFSFCKELDFESIPILKNLEVIAITDNGNKIDNLEFILEKFPNLKSLIFTRTELITGDLMYLLKHPTLQRVIIDHKKHYNLKEKEINSLLAKNQT